MLRFGCTDLPDEVFVRAFANGSLSAGKFHHGDHLRAAWLLLDRLPFDEALNALRIGLQTLATRAGVPRAVPLAARYTKEG